jgi:hypothetical protein
MNKFSVFVVLLVLSSRETLGYRTPKEKLNALILECQKNALLS